MKLPIKREGMRDRPSDLDIGRSPHSWAMAAQEFYCAAKVLHQETHAVRKEGHAGGQIMTEDKLMRLHLQRPILFCFGMAIELATKAALVKLNPGKWIPEGKKIEFCNHEILKYIESVVVNLSIEQKSTISELSEYVVHGKYPVGKTPSAQDMTIPDITFEKAHHELFTIYEELIGSACKKS